MLKIDVPSTWIEGSKICVVGEAPESASLSSFGPKSGKLLNKIIAGAGGDPQSFSLTNVAKRVPLDGYSTEKFRTDFYDTIELPTYTKTGKLSKKVRKVVQPSQELKDYVEFLRNELHEHKPNIVVATGPEALNALCGVSSIANYRGSLLESSLVPGLKVLPIYHPQWITTNAAWEYYYVSIMDMRKALAEAAYPELKRRDFRSIIAPSFDTVIGFLDYLLTVDAKWSFDIETRKGHVACLGLCYSNQALCIPLRTLQGSYWTPDEFLKIHKKLAAVFDHNPNLIGQNLNFDLDWMYRDFGIKASGIHLDTMVGQFILAPELPKGLDFICSLYTDAVYYKDEGKTWNMKIADEQLWRYNCKDTFYTLEAATSIEKSLKEQQLWGLWVHYGKKLIDMALEIQQRGIELNKARQHELQEILRAEYVKLREEVVETIGYDLNVNSPPMVQKHLMYELHLPLKKKRGTGKHTADEDAMMSYLIKPLPKKYEKIVRPDYKDHLTLIMKERHIRKSANYVGMKIKSGGEIEYDDLFADEDGIVRSMVNVCGTVTWRYSMSESIRGTGHNLQTDPKLLRLQYVAPTGRIFLQPDQRQAEARVVAWYAQCEKQIKLFSDPLRSIHLELGKKIFGRELSKDEPAYTAAKSGVHGGNFRMMAEKLAKTTNIDIATCEKALNGYHSEYPEIRWRYHNGCKAEVLSKGYLENAFGFKRHFYNAIGEVALTGKLSNDNWNDICSWLPQSTVPQITNRVLLALQRELDYVWVHQQGHDAFLISVPEGREDECTKKIMELAQLHAIAIKGRSLCIPWEMTMGYSWGAMYENYGLFPYTEWARRVEEDTKKGKFGAAGIIKAAYGVL